MKTKTLLLMILLGITAPQSWGAAEFYQNLVTLTENVVEITPLSSNTGGEINPGTGAVTPISAKFNIKTNAGESDYDFVLQATTKVQGGEEVNAYFVNGQSGYLILTNSSRRPDKSSVDNIKTSPSAAQNPNAIAWGVNVSSTGDIELKSSPQFGGVYYDITKASGADTVVIQSISGAPYAGTYSINHDSSGTYDATVILSAFRKP